MTTFLAIIFGTAVAGMLLEQFRDRLWLGSAACMVIAVIGTIAVAVGPPTCRRRIPT